MLLLSKLFKKKPEPAVGATSISREGIEFIKGWESLDLTSYLDGGGVWTIGYGHTLTAAPNQTITMRKATELLANDISFFEGAVAKHVSIPLTQSQFDALTSLAFNIGVSAFRKSTLLRLLNEGNTQAAAKEFTRWRFIKGSESKGLLNRRKAERELFCTTGGDNNTCRA